MIYIEREVYKNGYMLVNKIIINKSGWHEEIFYDDNLNYYKPIFINQKIVGFKQINNLV
jgi:hypothetical protein